MNRKAVGVYVVSSDGRLLLSQRGPKARHELYKWESIGGALEEGESFEEAAKRESLEELGLHIEILGLLSEHKSLADENGEIWHAKKYLARTPDFPVIKEPGVSIGFGWFRPSELNTLDLASYAVGDVTTLVSRLTK